jgi:phosphatidylglycerol:prolipoprotein diacylglycerol transferase
MGLLLGISLALREAGRVGYNRQAIMDMVFYVVVAGIVGSRILYVVQNFSAYRNHPLEAFKLWEGGLVFYGALLFGLPVGWLLMKRHGYRFWRLFDVFAPSLALGQAVGRMGCFFAGCCYGCPSELPWAITFSHPQSLAPTGVPLHPTQLYTSLALGVIFLILLGMRKHTRFPGELACVYLMLHSAVRFSIEFLRDDFRLLLWHQAISFTQVVSIGLFLFAAASYFLLSNKRGTEKS